MNHWIGTHTLGIGLVLQVLQFALAHHRLNKLKVGQDAFQSPLVEMLGTAVCGLGLAGYLVYLWVFVEGGYWVAYLSIGLGISL